jgi:HPt (histidine-containing phosphotransfer) domain-containing protein
MPLNRIVKPGNPQEPVDWEIGLACFDGRAALFERMLGRFLEMKAATGTEIRQSLARGDRGEAMRNAHSMVSSAGTIGAMELSGSARALEVALAAPPAEGEAGLLEAFEASLQSVMAALRERLGSVGK